ncbi:MAG: hypothetical protein D4R57_00115 [Verrucomicrobiales bacterium]|nr:MAG: hypothetical protein D4R57_00115 [Verrucomicrobiales bacterium]
MNEVELQKAYAEQTRRNYIMRATLGTFVSIPLNLFCSFMDHQMYPAHARDFFMMRVASVFLSLLGWLWLKTAYGREHPRWSVTWYLSPLLIILWMIYDANDVYSFYYAGLNIILLGMGLLTPWAYVQNLVVSVFVVVMYLLISLVLRTPTAESYGYIMNNVTFLILTGALVVSGSVANARLRLREFRLRWDLDISRNQVQEKNVTLDHQNKELADTIQKLTEAESQLVQSEKMASLGRMSAGIIHEINNPLNFATTGLFTLRKKAKHVAPEQQEEYNDILKDVEEGVTRVKNIVSDLRMFTHPNTDNLDTVDVNEVVTSALRFLSNEMKDKVAIEQKLAEGQLVHANKNKLIHVFVNLFQNSLDALKSKPFTNGERPTIWIETVDSSDKVELLVRDNGPGISSEHMDKIFDPFYTTKDVGEGMGLGLSICYRIMQEAKGRITVRTEPGKLCEFKLEFPKEPKAII